MNALGEAGVSRFGILIGFLIPIINVLAVSTLIWYSGQTIDSRERLRITLRALVSNPLIIGCLAGMAYSRIVGEFPVFWTTPSAWPPWWRCPWPCSPSAAP
jgi:predicted permease